MSEISFLTQDEALAYADTHGIAEEWTAKGQHDDGSFYDYQEQNIERRGTAFVIRDDTRKSGDLRGDPTVLTGAGPSAPISENPPGWHRDALGNWEADGAFNDPRTMRDPIPPATRRDADGNPVADYPTHPYQDVPAGYHRDASGALVQNTPVPQSSIATPVTPFDGSGA